MSESNSASNTENTIAQDDLSSRGLLERIDEVIQAVSNEVDVQIQNIDANLLSTTADVLNEIRETLAQKDLQLEEITKQSEALSAAQADAIVHSAEIIDELECTKQRLSDARLAAEKAAQDTQRLADTVFERSHDGVLVLNAGKCIACNDNTLELFGGTRSEIIGHWPTAFDTARFEDGSSAASDLHNLYQNIMGQSADSLEVLLRNKTNDTLWVEVTMSAFNMQDIGHALVVIRDITSRKQFEADLRRHRDFLDNIINAVPDQLSVNNSAHSLVVANDAFCTAHGVNRNEILGKNINTFLPPALGKRLIEIEEQLLATGKCKTTEHEYRGPDGERAMVSVKRSLFTDETSGESYLVATSRDITEDRLREDRLRLLASVFNGAAEGVAILSPSGQIREANPAFLEMASASRNPVGMMLHKTLQFDASEFENIIDQVAYGNSWAGKASVCGKEGSKYSYWVSLSPSMDTDEEPKRIIALVSDITELENAQEELRQQALNDNLTSLPNRRYFREHLQKLIDNPNSKETGISVCFLDLDDFKHVNDSAGHAAGDQLLKAVGNRIRRIVGNDAFVARFGGDEFAIIFEDTTSTSEQLSSTLENLLIAFREPFHLLDVEAVVGLSIGVTSYPEHATDVGTLMCNADIAMYASKTAGKSRLRIFTPEMQNGVNTRHQVETKLRRALKYGEIDLCYQPKICAKTRTTTGCEALARWRTSDGNYIPPGEFIPIAEQSGLIIPLGELVFHRAAEQACKWRAEGITSAIAVNVSPHQLRHPRFLEQLQNTLEETGAEADWFELEITEYAMMDDVDYAIKMIDKLSKIGFQIAIDDFGTGYSSLSYLKNFQIDTLKIDLSFVRDVTHDSQSNAIIRSIVSLGTGLGLNVVAEGVETEEQAAILTKAGCTELQGYFFGRPMDAQQYMEWLHLETCV